MATMEGPLSKWTNVVKGWQYRWFVLEENTGLLSYYTSKEKMMRGSRRGCVRLRRAAIGIDDEDDSTFTITVDQKTFHFQARDMDEKDQWADALQTAIRIHSDTNVFDGLKHYNSSRAAFQGKLAEADAYLQIMMKQVESLDAKIAMSKNENYREKHVVIKDAAQAMIESIKEAIVLLQISKASAEGSTDWPNARHQAKVLMANPQTSPFSQRSKSVHAERMVKEEAEGLDVPTPKRATVPDLSYSSSSDEDYHDAIEDEISHSPELSRLAALSAIPSGSGRPHSPSLQREEEKRKLNVIRSKDDYFDELYDDHSEEELDSLNMHGSVITHLLSQVRIGMDLTKIVLPTFILERRSLLEMFADFLAHPDLFVGIMDQSGPRDRMVQVVRWYLSAFHAGRPSEIAKKPYNPIIGETFQCSYDLPNEPTEGELSTDGPLPWVRKNSVAFIAEQVSHHPPISAFYAEHPDKHISVDGYIWTKSKFLGIGIGVYMLGPAVLTVIDHGEDYVLTFPTAYGRSILTVPWVELGGNVHVSCAKTSYYANITFHTKPFWGGKKHQITAEIFAPNEKKPFCTLTGAWNGVMWAKFESGLNEVFLDTKTMPVVKKLVKPIDQQTEFESRRLWKNVTSCLKAKNVEGATKHKTILETRQREEAKKRLEEGSPWKTKRFHEVGEHWVYDSPLIKRLNAAAT